MPSVYVSRRIMPRPRADLEASFEVLLHDAEWPPAREDVLAASTGQDGLIVMGSDPVNDELFDASGSQLRVVAIHAVGYDNVDLDSASRWGVVVANTPGVITGATAELTIALVLDLVRRITEGDRFLRSRVAWNWAPNFMLGTGLAGKALGIVGLGRIGSEVARLAEAFGMRIVYASRSPKDTRYERLALDDLLRTADVVTLHCPLTPETRHLIDAAALRSMRRDAVLVNASRGPVVDEAALVQALRDGDIAGAALDVYEREPEVHPGLLELPNVVLAPHLGSATDDARDAMGMLCVQALRAVLLEGRCPENALNPEVWGAHV